MVERVPAYGEQVIDIHFLEFLPGNLLVVWGMVHARLDPRRRLDFGDYPVLFGGSGALAVCLYGC